MRLEQTTSGQARGLHGDASRSNAHGYRLGARSSNQQRGRSVYALCLWPTMQYWGFLEGAGDFKARSTAKEHTNAAGRCGRPLDMGKRCVAAFRHGALNFFLSSFVATGIVVWTIVVWT